LDTFGGDAVSRWTFRVSLDATAKVTITSMLADIMARTEKSSGS
jgi:hypothetical protein